ncbi:MAG TPA: zinc ABC transporter substrate-binding protein [Pseudolysinimonas sp.]|nr:zinc ABC transporter substrate-binding protein [Pseudolysinimonas sp.]
MPTPRRLLFPLVALAASALALGGCAATSADPAADGVTRVVASTNVYGDLAATIAGDHAEVTSVIENGDQDPHQFEANPRVQLSLAAADLVIENGGGYDDFIDTMLAAADNPKATVLNAVTLSGHNATADGFNEHVFYDYPTMSRLVTAITKALSEVDPENAQAFEANAKKLQSGLTELLEREATIASEHGGAGVIITEPVPLYALERSGLINETPPAFSEAIEEDSDVPAALLQKVLDTISSGRVAAVVYNAQTGGPQTDAILAAAKSANVPAVPVTETLPNGEHYVEWQRAVLTAINQALQE